MMQNASKMVTEAIYGEIPQWVAECDPSWSAANSRDVTRRAWRVNVCDPAYKTPLKLWVSTDTETSRWEGEGTKTEVSVSVEEPSDMVGGWGGGERVDNRRVPVIHCSGIRAEWMELSSQ